MFNFNILEHPFFASFESVYKGGFSGCLEVVPLFLTLYFPPQFYVFFYCHKQLYSLRNTH